MYLSSTYARLNGSFKYNIDFMTYLVTHVESDVESSGKYGGNARVHDYMIHDTVYRCNYAKKLAFQWQLYSNASDLFLDGASAWLKAQQDLDDAFYLSEIPKGLIDKANATDTTAVNLLNTLTTFREASFDFVAVGYMKACYSNSEYRKHLGGLTAGDRTNMKNAALKLVTWYFYMIMRFVQYNANAKWKDVVGENIDFSIDLAQWPELDDAQKKSLKEMEANILEGVGPAFKVVEVNIKDEQIRERFTQYYRRFLDTFVYVYFALTNTSNNLYNKIAPNVIELKADGNLIMTLLKDQKFFTGDEANQLRVIKTAINQVGNALESGYMWVDFFKRDHDDSKFFKKVVDDYSFCRLINYRYKVVDHSKQIAKVYKDIIGQDSATAMDNEFFTNVAMAYPEFFLDALQKNKSDVDPDDLDIKKGLLKSIDGWKLYAWMLTGPINNLMITHAYNKADAVKEMSAVYQRYKNTFSWMMKHNKKTIENKLWVCRGCGGIFAMDDISRSAKFFTDIPLAAADKNTFKVAHRLVSSSSLVVSYKRLIDYKFKKSVDDNHELMLDFRAPSKRNNNIFANIAGALSGLSYKQIKFPNIQKEIYYKKEKYPKIKTDSEAKADKLKVGILIKVFKEIGKADVCIKGILGHADLVLADKNEYTYAVVLKKDASVSNTDLPGCEEIILKKSPTLVVAGETQLHYPIFMTRFQEFKAQDILHGFKSPYSSEGLEDTANMEGLSYITFGDLTDLANKSYDATKFNEYVAKANEKRDIGAYGIALDNPTCVYKNDKTHTLASYVKENLGTGAVDLTQKVFNFSEKVEGVNCGDLDTLLAFDSIKDFNATVKKVSEETANLGSFVVCGSFRKTVKVTSKKTMLFLTEYKGKIKEKMVDKKTPKIFKEYYFHARVSASFKFRDYVKVKLMPANWLKIKPIKLGDNNSYLILTVLTRISPASKFLGLAGGFAAQVNAAPKFDFPSFDKSVDVINTALTNQIYGEGILLSKFNANLTKFLKSPVKGFASFREFVKIKYDHNAAEACSSKMKGMSIILNDSYQVTETCGTNPLPIDKNYYIELIYMDTAEAKKNSALPDKFPPPTDDEMALAATNGYVLYNAGKKYDELDLKFGYLRFRIWVRPIMMMPYELTEKKDQ